MRFITGVVRTSGQQLVVLLGTPTTGVVALASPAVGHRGTFPPCTCACNTNLATFSFPLYYIYAGITVISNDLVNMHAVHPWLKIRLRNVSSGTLNPTIPYHTNGCSGVVVEYRTRNRDVSGSTHTRSTASNLEQVANLLCAQVNSASYPQQDGK